MADKSSSYNTRTGENTNRQFMRSGRFFCAHENWFFRTREGIDYGPFTSKTECRYAYNEFLELVSNQSELASIPVDFNDTGSEWQVPKISFN